MKWVLVGVTWVAMAGGAMAAGSIERACAKDARKTVSVTTCKCLQQTADLKLTKRQQRKVAKFFKTPDLAQKTRQSDRRSDEVLWVKYKDWTQFAAKVCDS